MTGSCVVLCLHYLHLQYCVAGLLWLPTLSAGLNIMSYTFAGYQPPFRCDISCEEKSEINLDNKTWYQKLDTSKINPQCEFFKYNPPDSYEGGCQAEYFSESDVVPCRHFVYDQSIFEETLVTNFDLVCSDTWKKGFVGNYRFENLKLLDAIASLDFGYVSHYVRINKGRV